MAHYLPVLLALGLAFANAEGAEDEVVLLTIEGDLIGSIENVDASLDDAKQAAQVINAYHLLLTTEERTVVEALHEEMLKFMPGFEVAYTAADSAEFSHLMSEMDLRLAAIQEIHAQKYTQDVVTLLNEAYQLILPTFGDEQ